MSWFKIVTTKFETVQSDLPSEKRKNVKKALLSGSTSATSKSSRGNKTASKAIPEKLPIQTNNEAEDDGSDKSHVIYQILLLCFQ